MYLLFQSIGLFLFSQCVILGAHVVDFHLKPPTEEREMQRGTEEKQNERDHAILHDPKRPDEERGAAFNRLVENEGIV